MLRIPLSYLFSRNLDRMSHSHDLRNYSNKKFLLMFSTISDTIQPQIRDSMNRLFLGKFASANNSGEKTNYSIPKMTKILPRCECKPNKNQHFIHFPLDLSFIMWSSVANQKVDFSEKISYAILLDL